METNSWNPTDADRLAIADGRQVTVSSRVGTLTATAEVTDTITPGVVSLPHGWGDRTPGVNSNLLTDEAPLDPLSGTAVLNGIPVEVTPERSAQAAAEPPSSG